ncbi:MAG: CHAT domain-containing tetratricopeptide repeat protein [Bacteroidota bacterium]
MYRFFTLLLLFNTTLYAKVLATYQPQQDSTTAKSFYDYAGGLYEQGKFDSAIYYYERAAGIFAKKGLVDPSFRSRIKVASTMFRQGKLENAIQYATDLVEEIKLTKGDDSLLESSALEVIANCHNVLSSFDEALVIQERILKIRESLVGIPEFHLADAHSNLAITYFRKGYIDESLESFSLTLQIRKRVYGMDHLLVADAHHNLGFFYYIIGEYDLSLEYYQIALSIYRKLYGEGHYAMGNVYNGIGQILEVKASYQEALTYFQKAHSVGKQVFGENHYLVADALTNMANVSYERGDYQQALIYNQKTLSINLNQYGENNIATAYSHLEMGTCYQELDNPKLARYHLKKSLQILGHIFEHKSPELANTHNTLGQFYLSLEDLDSGLFHFQKAIAANVIGFESGDLIDNPNINNALDKTLLLRSLYQKGSTLVKQHGVEKDTEHLKLALSTFQLCDTLYDQISRDRALQSDRLSLANVSSGIFEQAIRICKDLYDRESDEKYLELLFYFIEKSRGNLLHESISGLSARQYAAVPDSLITTLNRLQQDVSFWQSRLVSKKNSNDGKDTAAISMLENNAFDAKRGLEDLVRQIEKVYPQYYELKYDNKKASVNDVRSKLIDQGQVLLSYFMGDSTLYISAITKAGHRVVTLKKDAQFDMQLKRYRSGLSSAEITKASREAFDQYTESSYYLYQQLLTPVQDIIKGKDLIIVPSEQLALVPFEALLTEMPTTKAIDYQPLPYLIKSHRISYANSATILLNHLNSENQADNLEILALAPAFGNNSFRTASRDTLRSSLRGLVWNEQEIKSLSEHFKSDVHFGDIATEKVFKDKAGDYGMIHIASHGMVDHQHPMHSKIAFAIDKNDTLNDGYLHTFELFNTSLKAKMAVLSACNTGYGKVQKGEGVMSLGYAFAYAGVPSVIMSHWQVDDKSTSMLMNRFYHHLAEGNHKSDALRKAKLEMLENENMAYANPYYWAAFVPYGDDSPIIEQPTSWIWYVLVVALLILTAMVVWRKRKSALV